MRLLFDENLSPRLAQALQSRYPGSVHVRAVGLRGVTDQAIWEWAGREGFAIVSKDNDFRQLSFLHGAPPKVVWLSVGDAGTDAILDFLRNQEPAIQNFGRDHETALLVLALAPDSP